MGAPALQKTEAYMLYDDAYVYFGFRCFDSEPSQITAQLNRRDSDLLTDDAVIKSCWTRSTTRAPPITSRRTS